MKAVIVAAGKSTRMYPLTLNRPKALLEIGELTIIERSIDNLRKNKIEDIIVVVGCLRDQFMEKLKGKITFVHNPFYAITNDMASLWFAECFVNNDTFLYLHSDLVYHPDIIKRCIDTDGDIVMVIDRKDCDEEDMKVKVRDGFLWESNKELPLDEAYGEWIGIAKFSILGSKLMFEEIDNILSSGKFLEYDTYAFTNLAKKGNKIKICLTDGLPWIEIDFLSEYEKAQEIYKKLNNI